MNAEITKYVGDWFARGDDDLALVDLIRERGTGSVNLACFHAQQAVEKYLKGFLAHHELHVRKVHDLEALVEDCKKIDKSFTQVQDDARFLNQFYIESRYPDDFIAFSPEDMEEGRDAALRMREFVQGRILPTSDKNGFGLISILILVAIIALVSGGSLYFRDVQNQKTIEQIGVEKIRESEALKQKIEQQNKQAQSILNSENPAPPVGKSQTTIIDTLTWKTYRNDEYGFEMKYPIGWESIIKQGVPDTFGKSLIRFEFWEEGKNIWPANIRISIYSAPDNLDLSRWIIDHAPTDPTGQNKLVKEKSDTTLDAVVAKIARGSNFDSNERLIIAQKDGFIFMVGFDEENPNDPDLVKHSKIYSDILATFKFIKEKDERISCKANADCVLLLCSGARNKEWAKSAPPDLPCARYEGYTAQCVEQKCTAIKP